AEPRGAVEEARRRPRPGGGPEARRRARGSRNLLPRAHAGPAPPLPRAVRRARPGRDRLIGLPRPDPQDIQPLRRLRHLRPRRAACAAATRLSLQRPRFFGALFWLGNG